MRRRAEVKTPVELILAVPPPEWISAFNADCRRKEIGPAARPALGIVEWATQCGVAGAPAQKFTAHCGSKAYEAIHRYIREHTGWSRVSTSDLTQSCFFYDDAFWPLAVARLGSRHEALSTVQGMSNELRAIVSLDEPALRQLSEHFDECIYYIARRFRLGEGPVIAHEASELFQGAERSLYSARGDLLCIPPNPKAAELSRDAFEASLKALAVAKHGITLTDARAISHDLQKLVNVCEPLLSPAEFTRLDHARKIFPRVSLRYAATPFRGRALWECYFEAHYAVCLTLRIGNDDGDFRSARSW